MDDEKNTNTLYLEEKKLDSNPPNKKLGSFKIVILSVFIYLLIGGLLNLLYSWATDGNIYLTILGPIFLPAFIVLLFFIGLAASLDKPETARFKFIDSELIFLVLFIMSPIFLNLSSKIFNLIGNYEAAQLFYSQRFFSPIYIIALFIVYFFGKRLFNK